MSYGGYEFDSWYAIFVSFICWCSLYATAALALPDKTPEYWCRVVTFIHAVFSTFLGINQCFSDEWSFNDPAKPTTDNQAMLLVSSLGYFLEDLLWCALYQTEGYLMIAHHIYSCIVLFRMLMSGEVSFILLYIA